MAELGSRAPGENQLRATESLRLSFERLKRGKTAKVSEAELSSSWQGKPGTLPGAEWSFCCGSTLEAVEVTVYGFFDA